MNTRTTYQLFLLYYPPEVACKRRLKLCSKFVLKASKHSKWYSKTKPVLSKSHKKPKYINPCVDLQELKKDNTLPNNPTQQLVKSSI